MKQWGPYPWGLAQLLNDTKYKQGWRFSLDELVRDTLRDGTALAGGPTLCIWIDPPDAYNPDKRRPVVHYFIVPAATYTPEAWRRWLFDRIMDVELHEAMEFFTVAGEHPYAPTHGPGQNPYVIHEYRDDIERRTSFRGDVKEA